MAKKMKYNNEFEENGLKSLEKLPDKIGYSQYYGTWSFSSKDAGDTATMLYKAGTKEAWEGLGELYSRAAETAKKNNDGGAVITSRSRATSTDFTAYFAIRAFLRAGNEKKAIETLEKYGEYGSVVMTIKSNVGGEAEQCEGFDIPDLSDFPKFEKLLESMRI
jgi:hypothetical protein